MNAIHDPKYITGPIINRASGVAIPEYEPVIIFRAQDPLVREHAIKPYAEACAQRGLTTVHEAMIERYQAFGRFQAEHPERVKGAPDTSVALTQVGTGLRDGGMVAVERPYLYCLSHGNVLQFVKPGEGGKLLPGTTTEEVLDALIDRVTTQDAAHPCDENKDILLHLTAARSRQIARIARMNSTIDALKDAAKDLGGVERFGIIMIPCVSGNLDAYGYLGQTLALQFKGGRIYHYQNVPKSVYDGLIEAESKGGYAARHISCQFEGVRQDTEPATA